MELRRMECIVDVAEWVSFRRAAQRLHLSFPPPLTRQILALEREVGVRLLVGEASDDDFDRRREHLLTHARKALHSVEAASYTLSQDR